jgi:protein-L-isoaspartate O-methyltransferase
VDLDSIYASHPLRADTILGRLERAGADLAGLTEWDLAVDPETELTDQNHSGGVQAVLELAVASNITKVSTVVDVGAGIGGPARVLAAAFGCKVLGIERDAGRCRDASELNERVRLASLVSIRHADALTGVVDMSDVDVLWGQEAWVHFPSPSDFLARWIPALAVSGRVAMADAFLVRRPADRAEEMLITALEESWGAHLSPLDTWRTALDCQGYQVVHTRDVTARAAADCSMLLSMSTRWPEGTVTDAERQGWERAFAAFGRGIVGSFRVVAARR